MNHITLNKITIAIVALAMVVILCASYFVFMDDDSDDGDSPLSTLNVNGAEPTVENVSSGLYEIQRNLVLCTMGEPTGNVKAFLSWIMSSEGQAIVADEFVPLNDTSDYIDPVGLVKLNVGGSTTIQPIMIKLVDAYTQKYGSDRVSISVLAGGSGVGASNTANGSFDIGMCSRNLKQSEKDLGLKENIIGKDGVALLVNGTGVTDVTLANIAAIFSGQITNWKQLGGDDIEIKPVIRDDSSGTRECFDTIMKVTISGWTIEAGLPEFSSTNGVIEMVDKTPGAIGYVSIGALKEILDE